MLCRRFVRQSAVLCIALWGHFLSLRMLVAGCPRVLVLLTMASQVALGISSSVRALNNWISLGEQSERTEQTEGLLLLFTQLSSNCGGPLLSFLQRKDTILLRANAQFSNLIIVVSQHSSFGKETSFKRRGEFSSCSPTADM